MPLESHAYVTSFCNLIGGALAEPPEVNGLNPPMLPGSFLLRTDRGNEPEDEATHTSLVESASSGKGTL